MINLHVSMGLARDRTREPWICSQTYFVLSAIQGGPFADAVKGLPEPVLAAQPTPGLEEVTYFLTYYQLKLSS